MLCLYWTEEIQATFRLQSFGARKSSLANAEIYVLLYSFSLFYFEFEGNFTSTSPQVLIFEGAIYRRGFCVTSLGGLYLGRLIFGILRYSYKERRRIFFLRRVKMSLSDII